MTLSDISGTTERESLPNGQIIIATHNNQQQQSRLSVLNNNKMVEKIVRESYQKGHSRNISAVSDISVSLAEPLKRDENAEIRCILLCDSETERNCVFEAIRDALQDGESAIEDAQILQHHWEQPHVDCTGLDCRFCFRMSNNSNGGSGGGGGIPPAATSSHAALEGFFRFSIGGTTFRLMLLSKDRQNVLKIYSFDFLFVGMQANLSLDKSIWEFEWKRLERHSKKAVAPLVLFGYFRCAHKIPASSNGESALKRIVDEAKAEAKKTGKLHRAIPRFCDFVQGNSEQLCAIFRDVEKLYRHPGFVLQQCAIVNNLPHFSRIIENPNVTEEDVHYRDEDSGDNPIMIAAKLRHKDLVTSVLRAPRFQNDSADGNEFLRELIHYRNSRGQTLLSMVALQGT